MDKKTIMPMPLWLCVRVYCKLNWALLLKRHLFLFWPVHNKSSQSESIKISVHSNYIKSTCRKFIFIT